MTQLYKKLATNPKDYSRLGQTSQAKTKGPTIHQKILRRRTTEHGPEYQLFFLLVFLRQV